MQVYSRNLYNDQYPRQKPACPEHHGSRMAWKEVEFIDERVVRRERESWFVFVFILWSWSKLDLNDGSSGGWSHQWFCFHSISILTWPDTSDSDTVRLTSQKSTGWLSMKYRTDHTNFVRCFWEGNCSESEGEILKPFFFPVVRALNWECNCVYHS